MNSNYKRRPHWLKVKVPTGDRFFSLRQMVYQQQLHTVCQSAHCPNIGDCWGRGTATFMILGDICTRNCRFCAVPHGTPLEVDEDEPRRVAEAVRKLDLKYAVITSVTRDDLADGGAYLFVRTIQEIRKALPTCEIEVLIPDFQGSTGALKIVLDVYPTVLNHNLETVPRLYPQVRPQADYVRSLDLLDRAKKLGATTKTGLMLGLGETLDEVHSVMADLRKIDCDILTLGQYMQPGKEYLPIDRFVTPDEFQQLKTKGLQMGFKLVESAPLVRSSYHADEALEIK
ncbi:lipoyl synthase [candidate division KSB1 bacterium]|nr:lipoyl synthase [candidate division KSB1 bacterium]